MALAVGGVVADHRPGMLRDDASDFICVSRDQANLSLATLAQGYLDSAWDYLAPLMTRLPDAGMFTVSRNVNWLMLWFGRRRVRR